MLNFMIRARYGFIYLFRLLTSSQNCHGRHCFFAYSYETSLIILNEIILISAMFSLPHSYYNSIHEELLSRWCGLFHSKFCSKHSLHRPCDQSVSLALCSFITSLFAFGSLATSHYQSVSTMEGQCHARKQNIKDAQKCYTVLMTLA